MVGLSFVSMLWKKSTVEFAAEDVQNIVNKALPQVIKSVGERVYITNDDVPALITQSHVQRKVEELLNTATKTLDTTDIAAKMKLTKAIIDTVIVQAVSSSNSFFDGIHVLPSKRIDAIGDAVLAKGEIRRLSDICHEEKITVKAAQHAVKRQSPHLIIVGHEDFVVPEMLLEKHVTQFKEALDSAEGPIKFSSIEKDPILLPLVKLQLHIPAHEQQFLPKSYISGKLAEAEELLGKSGYITASFIKEIEEPVKFAKRTKSVLLGTFVVNRDFISQEHKKLVEKLNNKGYVDLRDTKLYPNLTRYIIEEEDATLAKFRIAKYPAHYLVKPSLERDLLSKVNKELKKGAVEQANEMEIQVTGSSTIGDFNFKLPTLTNVKTVLDSVVADLPVDLKFGEQLLPRVCQNYTDVCTKTIKPRLEAAIEKLESKVRCYLNGILTLPADSEVQTMAWEEWQQYVSEQQFSVPANMDVAQQQFKVSEDVLKETTKDLQQKARARLIKLSKPKDAALILHLATTVYHSQHFCPAPGFLKIRGKAVPKLMKQFEFPSCFNELRKELKTPSAELLKEAKAIVQQG